MFRFSKVDWLILILVIILSFLAISISFGYETIPPGHRMPDLTKMTLVKAKEASEYCDNGVVISREVYEVYDIKVTAYYYGKSSIANIIMIIRSPLTAVYIDLNSDGVIDISGGLDDPNIRHGPCDFADDIKPVLKI